MKKETRDRILIKARITCLKELVNHGYEYMYKPWCKSSRKGSKYMKNFGSWTKNIKDYKMVILGENYYNYDVSKYIKSINPKCKIIIFFWNIMNFNSYFEIIKDPNVDEIYTFDEQEAKKHKFKYNSTYYSKKVKLPNSKINSDVFFVGGTKDRKEKILEIEKKIRKQNLITNFKMIEDDKDYISYKKYLKLLSKSKAILDYNAYDQVGLSLRVMESLFFEKKLITSNKNIKKCAFYNKNNIFIIDIDKWKDLNKFINSDYEKIDKKIIEYYDFDSWIKRFK